MATDRKSTDKVLVGMNWAHDLKFTLSNGNTVTLNGAAHDLKGKDMGVLPRGEFGLTWVKKTEWEDIQNLYGKTSKFVNGLIFAAEDRGSALDEAEDRAETRHGLEAVEPKTTRTKKVDD